jgi:hypothetical protein
LVLAAQHLAAGPASLDDALSALREARRIALQVAPADRDADLEQKQLRALAKAFDLLAGHRKGALNDDQIKEAESDAKYLEQVAGPHNRWKPYLPDANELNAARAIALQRTKPKASLALWKAYVEGAPNGPWVAHAKTNISALEKLP